MDVWIVGAEDEEALAELIAEPLRVAGYRPIHWGTLQVGDTMLGSVDAALGAGTPVILAATRAAMGDVRCQSVVNAARAATGNVLVIRMHPRAAMSSLDKDNVIADYTDDPQRAIGQLVESVKTKFPLAAGQHQWIATAPVDLNRQDFLDQGAYAAEIRKESLVLAGVRSDFDDQRRISAALIRLGVMRNSHLTLAGLLLFGINPQSVLPSAIVQCFAYDGVDITEPVFARAQLRGNLIEQIDGAIGFVREHSSKHEAVQSGTAVPAMSYAYSDSMVREVVANALVHRDYRQYGGATHLNLFSDRLVIVNPGAWGSLNAIGTLPTELRDVPRGSHSPNPRLSAALSQLGYVEAQGSGIPKIVKQADEAQARPPFAFGQNAQVEVTIFPARDHDVTREALAAEAARRWSDASISSYMSSDVHIERRLRPSDGSDESRPYTAERLLSDGPSVIAIIDRAGSGKTSFMRYLAFRATSLGMIPIFVSARDYTGGPVAAWIATSLKSAELSRQGIMGVLGSSDVILLVDALDEVALTLRGDFARQLRDLAHAFTGTICIAGRPLPWVGDLARDLGAAAYGFESWSERDILEIGTRAGYVPEERRKKFISNRFLVEVLNLTVSSLGLGSIALSGMSVWKCLEFVASAIIRRELTRQSGRNMPENMPEVYRTLAAHALSSGLHSETLDDGAVRNALTLVVSNAKNRDRLFQHVVSGVDPFLVKREHGVAFAHPALFDYYAADWLVRHRDGRDFAKAIARLVNGGQQDLASLAMEGALERWPQQASLEAVGSLLTLASNESIETGRGLRDFARHFESVVDSHASPGPVLADSESLEASFRDAVFQLYRDSASALNLAWLASRLIETLGDVLTRSHWMGHGSFVRALRSLQLPNAKFSSLYLWDSTRHRSPEDA